MREAGGDGEIPSDFGAKPAMIDPTRFLSALIALGYIVAMWTEDGWQSALAVLIPLTVPLGLIWYGEALGAHTGFAGRARISQQTPPALLRAFGWLLLVAPLGVFLAR